MPIMARKIVPDSVVYSDSWRGYNVLDVSDFKHYRINHSETVADAKNHINGIENFGTRRGDICASLTVYQRPISVYF
jgi:transposase